MRASSRCWSHSRDAVTRTSVVQCRLIRRSSRYAAARQTRRSTTVEHDAVLVRLLRGRVVLSSTDMYAGLAVRVTVWINDDGAISHAQRPALRVRTRSAAAAAAV